MLIALIAILAVRMDIAFHYVMKTSFVQAIIALSAMIFTHVPVEKYVTEENVNVHQISRTKTKKASAFSVIQVRHYQHVNYVLMALLLSKIVRPEF